MLTSESLPYLDLRNAYFDLAYTCTSLLKFFYKNKTQNLQQMKCYVIHEKKQTVFNFPDDDNQMTNTCQQVYKSCMYACLIKESVAYFNSHKSTCTCISRFWFLKDTITYVLCKWFTEY